MQLVNFDFSRVILLTSSFRPEGQSYVPELIAKTVSRYQFLKYPTAEEILQRNIKFAVGKYADIQIQEFDVYNDGVLATSGSDTDKIEGFIFDVLDWLANEAGVVPAVGVKQELYFESTLIVKADVDLTRAIAPKADLQELLNRTYRADKYVAAPLVPSAFFFDSDTHGFPGRRKPFSFSIDRRLGVPFEDNIFYCRAPFRTQDHLSVLRAIEDLVR